MAKGQKTGGRKKGTPNKVNADIKGMVLEALHAKGGAQYLIDQAELNPVAFMGLVGKVLPMTVTSDPDSPVKIVLECMWQMPVASSAGKS
jgi:hypothetical protein